MRRATTTVVALASVAVAVEVTRQQQHKRQEGDRREGPRWFTWRPSSGEPFFRRRSLVARASCATSSSSPPSLATVDGTSSSSSPVCSFVPRMTASQLHAARKTAMETLARFKETSGAPGVSVCVSRHGDILLEGGVGFADVENLVPMTHRSVVRIASISKVFTAMVLGILLERGLVRLDDDVRTQLPESLRDLPAFRPVLGPNGAMAQAQVITPRYLAAHLSGIRHYKAGEFQSRTHYDSVAEAAALVAVEQREIDIPGSKYLYTSHGYTLLSTCLENQGGHGSFNELLRKLIIEPAGLSQTFVEEEVSIIPNRGRQYQRPKGSANGLQNASFVDNSLKIAGGGLISSASDLTKLGEAILAGNLVSRNTLETTMWQPQRTLDGTFTEYALGWELIETRELPQLSCLSKTTLIKYHRGGAHGGTTVLMLLPEDGMVVTVLTNLQGVAEIRELAASIAREFL